MTDALIHNPQLWGNLLNPDTQSRTTLTASTTRGAFGFFLDRDRTITGCRVFFTKTGSPIAADIVADLFDMNSAGNPNASLATFGTPSGISGWVDYGGVSVALTANTMYFVVFKNVNGTPASNFVDIERLQQGTPNHASVSGNSGTRGWGVRRSTNSGTSWINDASQAAGIRLAFADGTFAGLPAMDVLSGVTVYSSREAGAICVTPGVDLAVRGVSFPIARNSTPTGQLRYRLYTGASSAPTLLATTGLLPSASGSLITTSSPFTWIPLFFSSVVTIPASSTLRVVMSETTQSDASLVFFRGRSISVDNNADSKALLGNFYRTLSTDGGTTFSETDTEFSSFALILDTGATGSSGAPGGLSVPRASLNNSLLRYRRGHLP